MRKKTDAEIPHRNRNQTGWWIVNEVGMWVSDRRKKLIPASRCTVWVNTRLIKAGNREEAYAKAMKVCAEGYPSRTDGGEWRFAGISMLLPVNYEIGDGAEILWTKAGRVSLQRIKKMVKSKNNLPVFDDTPAPGDLPFPKVKRRTKRKAK